MEGASSAGGAEARGSLGLRGEAGRSAPEAAAALEGTEAGPEAAEADGAEAGAVDGAARGKGAKVPEAGVPWLAEACGPGA